MANSNPINKQREKGKRGINNTSGTGITKEGTIKKLEERKMKNQHKKKAIKRGRNKEQVIYAPKKRATLHKATYRSSKGGGNLVELQVSKTPIPHPYRPTCVLEFTLLEFYFDVRLKKEET